MSVAFVSSWKEHCPCVEYNGTKMLCKNHKKIPLGQRSSADHANQWSQNSVCVFLMRALVDKAMLTLIETGYVLAKEDTAILKCESLLEWCK